MQIVMPEGALLLDYFRHIIYRFVSKAGNGVYTKLRILRTTQTVSIEFCYKCCRQEYEVHDFHILVCEKNKIMKRLLKIMPKCVCYIDI